jgi:hypothetical protein
MNQNIVYKSLCRAQLRDEDRILKEFRVRNPVQTIKEFLREKNGKYRTESVFKEVSS